MTEMILPGGMSARARGLHETAQRGGHPAEPAVSPRRTVLAPLDLRGAELPQRDQLVGAGERIAEGAAAVERKNRARNAGPPGDRRGAEWHRGRVERGERGQRGAVGVGGAPDHDLVRLGGACLLVAREAPNSRRLGLKIVLVEGCQLCL